MLNDDERMQLTEASLASVSERLAQLEMALRQILTSKTLDEAKEAARRAIERHVDG